MKRVEHATPLQIGKRWVQLTHRSRLFASRHLFLRDVAILAGGSVIAQALPIVFTPVLTRMYSPHDIGLLGLFTSFINFAASAATLGYALAIVTGKDDREGAILTALSALVVVPMAVIETLGLAALSRGHWLGFDQLSFWGVAAMIPALLLTGVYTSLRYWMIRIEDYRGISRATIAQSFGRLGVQLGAGMAGLAAGGLLAGEVLGRTAGLRQMYAVSKHALTPLWRTVGLRDLWETASAYKKFPLLSAPSLLLNGIALALPVPLIAAYFSVSVAGQYAVAARVMVLPTSLIGLSVSDVFHRRIAEISRTHPEQALRFLARAFLSLFALALLPAAVITVGAEQLFAVVLGKEWGTAGSLAVAIVPWTVMQFSVSPLTRIVQVYQAQESQLLYNVLCILNIVGIMSYGHVEEWTLIQTVSLVSWTQAVVYAFYLVLLFGVIRRRLTINAVSPESGAQGTCHQ